jgi:hypothetical protein
VKAVSESVLGIADVTLRCDGEYPAIHVGDYVEVDGARQNEGSPTPMA